MKEQDYNNLITSVSNRLVYVNQLLYEILVIITLYIFLDRIQTNLYLSHNATSVIIIFTILALGVDWFIWSNPIQTFLFGAILLIYIRYNMSNMQIISSFIDMTGEYANVALFQPPSESTTIKCNTPRIPEMVDLPYDTADVKPYGIMAYDRNDSSISSIQDSYKSDQPLATITDSNYARIMLNELYQTPQYRNNHPPNEIDSSLANDIYQTHLDLDTKIMIDEELLESFRHPKRQFIDSQWLSTPIVGTYNDNNLCKNGICKNDNKSSRDAICNVAQFGKKLEQCTNQEYSVSDVQLDKISNNYIPYEDF
jgi:hypothetical protein